MDRLDAMAMFVTAVDEGSLAAAARKLGRSAPSLARVGEAPSDYAAADARVATIVSRRSAIGS
jgi:hypothetical protein